MENMPECEICPTDLFEGSKIPGGSATSHLVLPIHYIFNSLHQYFPVQGYVRVVSRQGPYPVNLNKHAFPGAICSANQRISSMVEP